MPYPAHLTSTQAMSVGSGRLELHRSVLRYCSELEGKEELMLKASRCLRVILVIPWSGFLHHSHSQ